MTKDILGFEICHLPFETISLKKKKLLENVNVKGSLVGKQS